MGTVLIHIVLKVKLILSFSMSTFRFVLVISKYQMLCLGQTAQMWFVIY